MLSARAPRAAVTSRKALQAWRLIWRAPTLAPLASPTSRLSPQVYFGSLLQGFLQI